MSENSPSEYELRNELISNKTKSVPLLFSFNKRCVITFDKGDVPKINRFDLIWRTIILVLFGIEVLFTTIDLILTKLDNQNGLDIKSELKNPALDIV